MAERCEMLMRLLQSVYLKSNFQKMVEQTNDVLSFFNIFEKTCTLHGIQGQHVVRIFAKSVK